MRKADEPSECAIVTEEHSPPSTLVGPRPYNPHTLRSSTYPTSRLAARFEPIDQIEAIKESDRMLGAVASGKLKVVAEQIRNLQEMARKIIEEAEMNMELHRASCAFVKRPGHVYHLYQKDDGLYFSLLSPEDWRGSPPHSYMGSYKLSDDMTWTLVQVDT